MKDYQVTIDLAKKHLSMEEVDPDVWASDVAKLIRIIESVPAETLAMPKIAEENYRMGLQFGIDYCDTQMNILQEIYKDQPVTSLKAIQKYLDVKKQLVNERDSNFTV